MYWKLKVLLGCTLIAVAPAAFAQYTIDMTGVGNGTVANGVYVSPYQGTITGNGLTYTGYMICDDFYTDSYLNAPWSASMTSAGALDGSEKFPGTATFDGSTYSAQQAYNAAGWLANGLLANLNDPNSQVNYSFAIWNVFDGQQTDPNGGALALESAAFSAVSNGYVATNVSVFTPRPINASQEFLVVSPPVMAPEIDPASIASGLTLLFGGLAVLRGRRGYSPGESKA
ncbi:MAG TPA: hypothetical protein VK743_09425 [Steroidobacteraceae bacterium]|jgi:hypothetical protein|nr:hypothetical protein [Steroidobacteraceae bacterium]